jgi:L-asparaginase
VTRVHLLATGGTIASRSHSAGRRATVKAGDLLGSLSWDRGPRVTTEDVTTKGSYTFDSWDLLDLARRVGSALEPDVTGIVITHGTDVMEESAFLLHLLHQDTRPVVLTGAQRPFDDPAPDGPANLRDALVVAASPVARDRGVLVVFDGFVYTARGVRKVDTLSTRAFDAPGRGPVMRVADGRVMELAAAPPWRPVLMEGGLNGARGLERLPRVDVICAYPGADGALLDASVTAGALGIVVAALGAGNVGPELAEAIATAIAQSVPVLICSRVGAGPVLPLYAGGGAALKSAGAHFGSDLSPWQGRLLLALACAIAPEDPGSVLRSVLGPSS